MNRLLLLICVAGGISMVAAGCGEEPEEIDPFSVCEEEELSAYVQGSASGEDSTASFDVSNDGDTPGRVTPNQIRMRLGEASPPGTSENQPLRIRMADPDYDGRLYETLSELDRDDPLVLQVTDGSELPPGGEDLMSVDHLDCSVNDERICVHIGYDATGDGLGDDDEFVYVATGGTVTFQGFDGRTPARFRGHFDIETGPNLHTHQDESTGQAQGCFRTRYNTGGSGDFWELH